MLLVIFQIGSERYALDSREVVEIVPLARLKGLIHAPEYLAGLLHYRGQIVPVLDLCSMAGAGPARRLLSSRIILVRYPSGEGESRTIGLLAERVTDTIKASEADFSPPGIKIKDSPYLGDVMMDAQGMVQCIRLAELLPAFVREMLFSSDRSGSSDAS